MTWATGTTEFSPKWPQVKPTSKGRAHRYVHMPRAKGDSRASFVLVEVKTQVAPHLCHTRPIGVTKDEREERSTVDWRLKLRASF